MKRYIMFRGSRHDENSGGLNDFVCSEDSIEECMKHHNVMQPSHWWVHFLDLSTGEMVEIYDDGREVREKL